jgi:hypothetical protein
MNDSITSYSICFLCRFKYADSGSIFSAVTVKLLLVCPLYEIIDAGKGQLRISALEEK